MASIISTVSLDEKTKAIAEELPNFSHFVRECLLRYNAEMTTDQCNNPHWNNREDQENQGRFEGRCNPMHKDFTCFHCWPWGRPTKEQLKDYTSEEINMDELMTLTRKWNKNLFHMGGRSVQVKESKKSTSDPPLEATFLSKLLRKFK